MTKLLSLIASFLLCAVAAFAQNGGQIQTPLSGTITAQSTNCSGASTSCVWQNLPNNVGTTTISLTGTFTGTLLVEESNNGGQTWATAATLSGVGTTTYATNGFTDVRVRCSAYTSGSAVVTLASGIQQVISTINTVTSGLPAANSPNLAIPGPAVFNVKNYGATGNTQESDQGVFTATSNIVTCANCAFTSADVGKRVCGGTLFITQLACTTILSVDSATQIHAVANATGTNTATIMWGTPDDTGVGLALAAAIAAMKSTNTSGSLGTGAGAPILYFPSSGGGYNLCTQAITVAPGTQKNGFYVLGDGMDITRIYAGAGCTYSAANAFMSISGNAGLVTVKGMTLEGGYGSITTGFNAAILSSGSYVHFEDLRVQRFSGIGLNMQASGQSGERVHVLVNGGGGIECVQCTGEFYRSLSSNNNPPNLLMNGVTGLSTGQGFHWNNGLIDECGTTALGCTQVVNSTDVWFQGAALFGTPTGVALSVDGFSSVHIISGIVGVFAQDTNTGGLSIAAGGLVQASDTRFTSTGTKTCITNNGVFNDVGGNTCESQFAITSGTSTGTTAVLTLTNQGAAINTNCSIGDTLQVENAAISGYNGYFPLAITATSATTLTYLTTGSNLGALGAGGTAFCKNLQQYSGNLPKALLTPTPNTCYITGVFAAVTTGAPICNFFEDRAMNIYKVKAASTISTTCATAPIMTISDGTSTITLTLTSGKSQWDSAVDTSTGVGTTVFKPGGTIQVTGTSGTCATPPTNFSITYQMQAILSN